MKNIYHSLFWRLSLFFLATLLVFSSVYIYITYTASQEYVEETSQKLNRNLAQWVADHTAPLIQGEINKEELDHLFHSTMVINPSVEIYLLNNEGDILSYFAPAGKVKLDKVGLEPINAFIADDSSFIKGEDPRNPGVEKIFSACRLMNENTQVGYLYIILASEEYASVADKLAGSFRMKLAAKSIIATLLCTLIIGIFIIWFLTKNLNRITSTVSDFKQGNLNARINLKSKGELSVLANNFDEMADTIVENIEEIKSVENLRKELITNISHDLRTPLTSIQGYAETLLMLEENLDKESKLKYTNIILSSTQKVKKLVDDLFEISKLESNQIQTKKESFSIKEMLSDIIAKYELIAKSKTIDLEVTMPEKDVFIYADFALIDRVFQNLLDNALKHTSSGEKVTISVKAQGSKSVEVSIKDTGIGIIEDELPYIFERYKKAKNNTKEGAGLGLAIVKKILDLHQIEISVDSKINKGTQFRFELPVVE